MIINIILLVVSFIIILGMVAFMIKETAIDSPQSKRKNKILDILKNKEEF